MDLKDSVLKRELEAPTGLSLLVAALDAQDPKAFRIHGGSPTTPSTISDHRFSLSPPSAAALISGSVSGRRRSIPDNDKTDAYWEKRRRNNEAAKRSREKRRYNDMAMEAKLFELSKENNILKSELTTIKHHKPSSNGASFQPIVQQPAPPKPVIATVTPSTSLPLPGSIASVMPQLGAALGTNPAAAHLHTSPPILPTISSLAANPLLAAVVPPILLQAAAAVHHQRLHGVFEPHSPLPKQHSPDSTGNVDDRCIGNQSPILSASLLDTSKQYLRYKLLERQSRLTIPTPSSALLGSLASTAARPLLCTSVTKTEADSMSLKECLSSLAVTLTSPNPFNGSNQSSPHSDHGYDTQDRDHISSGNTSCGDSSSGECARSHTGSFCDDCFGADLSSGIGKKRRLSSSGVGSKQRSLSSSNECDDGDQQLNNDDHYDKSVNGSGNETERYIERRRRNNEAAKRCRANRRALFEFRFQRAQELEQENNKLKDSIKQLTDEVNDLKMMLAKKQRKQNVSPDLTMNGGDGPLDFSIKKTEDKSH